MKSGKSSNRSFIKCALFDGKKLLWILIVTSQNIHKKIGTGVMKNQDNQGNHR